MSETKIPEKAFKNQAFLASEEARPIRILSEYFEPLYRLAEHKVNSTILFFGSTQANPDKRASALSRYYWEAEELAFLLTNWAIGLKPKGKNFVICTGGGPGIMEAGNRGAQRAGGKSIGMNISIPLEQSANRYISPELGFIFHYFFMRKFWLVVKAKAIIAFPGGFGTLDEIFETITLTQVGKIPKKEMTILLYGEEYWRQLINFDTLIRYGAISPEDMQLITFSSSPKDAFDFLRKRLLATLPAGNVGESG
ncbi:MAG TPA: TIGR00730 family Rossman fold protein [Candidatus Aminicenantes bacterium]|nr:TIGR00730 family Rossman fold protein [Candidatus Aminicenantes bacterium]